MSDYTSFIEVQFPVSRVSKESYKERKSNNSQTLTGLGKWWGRKPLVLVRAAVLGLLLPASADPADGRNVVILPDVRGLHPYYEALAVRFAEAGFHAVAFDYFGRTQGAAQRP